jgi:hypothetical protein
VVKTEARQKAEISKMQTATTFCGPETFTDSKDGKIDSPHSWEEL